MPSNNACVLNCKTGSSARENLGPSARTSPTHKSAERARAGVKTKQNQSRDVPSHPRRFRAKGKEAPHPHSRPHLSLPPPTPLPLPRVIPGRRPGTLSAAEPSSARLPPRLPRVIHSLHFGPSPPAGPYTLCLALAEATGGAAPLLLGLCPPSLQQRYRFPSSKRAEATGTAAEQGPRCSSGSREGKVGALGLSTERHELPGRGARWNVRGEGQEARLPMP